MASETDQSLPAPTAGRSDTTWLMLLLVVSVLLPDEIGFTLFGGRFNSTRVILIVLLPCVLVGFVQRVGHGQYRFVLADLLTMSAVLWLMTAAVIVDGVEVGMVKGGSIALDYLVSYAAMRILVRSAADVRSIVLALSTGLAVVGYLSVLDPLTNGPALHRLASMMTGNPINPSWGKTNLTRFSLFRAAGTFDHSILLGVAMVCGLMLSRSLKSGRVFAVPGYLIGLAACLASAPMLGGLVAVGLLTYAACVSWRNRWWALLIAGALAFLFLLLVHPRPFGFLFSHMMLDPETGYFRLLIWQFGGENVWAHPWLGIGLAHFDSWVRPAWMGRSVDALWLRLAMQSGIPASALLFLALVASMWLPVRSIQGTSTIGGQEERLAESLAILLAVIIFIGFTVDYWGANWTLTGIFSGLRVALYQLAQPSERSGPASATDEWKGEVLRSP